MSQYYENVAPPTASNVYKNVNEITRHLSESLAAIILDRITKLDMQNEISFSSFYKDVDMKNGSEEYYLFQSEHYRRMIFNMAEKIIHREGYTCSINADDTARQKKIAYDAIVIHPLKKFGKMMLYFSPIALTYGIIYLNDYITKNYSKEKSGNTMML
jgi:hypothetical protein